MNNKLFFLGFCDILFELGFLHIKETEINDISQIKNHINELCTQPFTNRKILSENFLFNEQKLLICAWKTILNNFVLIKEFDSLPQELEEITLDDCKLFIYIITGLFIGFNQKNLNENNKSFYDKFVENASKSKVFSNMFVRNDQEEEKLEYNIINVNYFRKGIKSKVQVLRSSCDWSVGIKKKENSILQAYIELIRESKHYIYIENQFFVSKAFDDDDKKNCKQKSRLSDLIQNTIAYEIRKRIIKAYEEGKKFRVMVFIPLLPGFAGEPEESGTLQIILKYTYAAIYRNYGTSIIEKLKEKMGEEWKNYIGFYSLRGHGLVNGVPTTEIIYIHSKLMIVDDKKVIIGSANINDRSMLGERDSEFCVLIHEKEKRNFIIDGKRTGAANFAHSFRTNLMAEHIGLDVKDELLFDPLNDELWKVLNDTAKNNTEIYHKLFYCYPDDNMKTFKEVLKMKRTDKLGEKELKELKELYQNEKNNIKGHVVYFPLHFLLFCHN